MKHFYLFVSIFLLAFGVKSQVIVTIGNYPIGYTKDVEGTVTLKNGDIISGNLTLPGSFDTEIKVNDEKIAADKVEYIDAHHSKNENSYRFVYTELKRYKKNGELKDWQGKPGWIVLLQTGSKANMYKFAPQYRLNSKGELLLQINTHTVFPIFGIKNGSKEAIMISISSTDSAMEIGTRSLFKNGAKQFFSDNPSLVNKIENKELGIEDIPTIFNIYNEE